MLARRGRWPASRSRFPDTPRGAAAAVASYQRAFADPGDPATRRPASDGSRRWRRPTTRATMLAANSPGARAAGAQGRSGSRRPATASRRSMRRPDRLPGRVLLAASRPRPHLGLHPARQRRLGGTRRLLRPHPHRPRLDGGRLEDRRAREAASARRRSWQTSAGAARRLRRDRPGAGAARAMSWLRRRLGLLAGPSRAGERWSLLAQPAPAAGAGQPGLRRRQRPGRRGQRRGRRDHRRDRSAAATRSATPATRSPTR